MKRGKRVSKSVKKSNHSKLYLGITIAIVVLLVLSFLPLFPGKTESSQGKLNSFGPVSFWAVLSTAKASAAYQDVTPTPSPDSAYPGTIPTSTPTNSPTESPTTYPTSTPTQSATPVPLKKDTHFVITCGDDPDCKKNDAPICWEGYCKKAESTDITGKCDIRPVSEGTIRSIQGHDCKCHKVADTTPTKMICYYTKDFSGDLGTYTVTTILPDNKKCQNKQECFKILNEKDIEKTICIEQSIYTVVPDCNKISGFCFLTTEFVTPCSTYIYDETSKKYAFNSCLRCQEDSVTGVANCNKLAHDGEDCFYKWPGTQSIVSPSTCYKGECKKPV